MKRNEFVALARHYRELVDAADVALWRANEGIRQEVLAIDGAELAIAILGILESEP